MAYDPADWALAFTPAGDLIVSHLESYTSGGDVVSSVCTGTGFYRLPAGRGAPRSLVTGEPVCHGVGEAAASADGTWAVHAQRVRPNNSVLVRVDLGTGRADTLRTACAVYLHDPSISPDGRTIAAVGRCRGRDQESFGLYTMRADGSDLREIVPGRVSRSAAAWSPDGQRLVYERAGGWLALVGADGSGERLLTPGSGPAWSPDGRWIAFVADGPARREKRVFLIRPDGTDRRPVFVNRETSTFSRGWGAIREGLPWTTLLWSPDSRWLAFSRVFGAGTSIWRVDVESGIVQQVTRPDR
ncbi:MAG TPA: hypothetical protein VHG93_02110 [Longimicrobium sp.]|nr:hypothetical protein [Longimicrobium sp.]